MLDLFMSKNEWEEKGRGGGGRGSDEMEDTGKRKGGKRETLKPRKGDDRRGR
jgi:hypothetical protein